MPSSMIFVGFVVLWLLILVPAVARHRQEVARPTVAALSGRVLTRSSRRHNQEVDGMSERDRTDAAVDRARELSVAQAERHREEEPFDDGGHDLEEDDDRDWERPPARYRAGRGGFDAEAAALAARARYAFRQRVVLAMLFAALVTGIVAGVAVPGLWWPHSAIDLMLVGYLAYLRRQVQMEETIRARRAARLAGTRRTQAADDPELDDWAERGRAVTPPRTPEPESPRATEADDELEDDSADADHPVATVVEEDRPALPRLRPIPLPPLPAGTAVVDDEDAELDLDGGSAPGYRRAVGQ